MKVVGNLKYHENILNWVGGVYHIIDANGYRTSTIRPLPHEFDLPELNSEIFTGQHYLVDLYNALKKAIINYSFVGKYWPANPMIDNFLVIEIVNQIPNYKGECYMNIIHRTGGSERFHSFSDEPINTVTESLFTTTTIYSVPMYTVGVEDRTLTVVKDDIKELFDDLGLSV